MNTRYPSDAIRIITEFLFIEEPITSLPKADLVVVFGSEFIQGTIDAIELLMSHTVICMDSRVILSGATGGLNAGKESEAKRMYEEALKRGLPSSMFLVEDRAANARENLEYSKEIIAKLGGFERFNTILFVGKAFMLRRTQMAASSLHYPLEKVHYYGLVDKQGKNIGADCWWKEEASKIRVMQELERIGKYAVKGDLSLS